MGFRDLPWGRDNLIDATLKTVVANGFSTMELIPCFAAASMNLRWSAIVV